MLIYDLSPKTLLQITGPDASKFLQGQLTADVNEVTPKQSRLTGHCNAKGRVLFTGRLLTLRENHFLLQLPPDMAEHALASLKKYAIFSKVQLSIIKNIQQFGITGTPSPEFLTQFNLKIPSEIDQVSSSNENWLIRVPGDRYELFCLKNLVAEQNFSSWQCLEIQNGLAWIEPSTMGEFTPHQLNFPAINAVNFKKGCYTGQEIVARMQYLGKLKEELCLLTWENNSYPAGTDCHELDSSKSIGTLVCSAEKNNQWQGLASLRLDRASKQTVALDKTMARVHPADTVDQFA